MSDKDNVKDDIFHLRLDILYVAISAITLVECVFTFFINMADKILREKPATTFANNLAGSIGFLSSISFVCNVCFLAELFPTGSIWPCLMLSVFVRYLHTVSCLSLACLSLDRYLAICWPLHYYYLLTRSRCRLLSLACWATPCVLLLLPCASELPILCSETAGVSITFLFAYTVVYTLGAIATFVFYVLVALEFRRERGGHAQDKRQMELLLRARTAKSAVKVVAFYVIFSLPHTIYPIVDRALLSPGSLSCHLKDAFHVTNRIHLLLFLPVYVWVNAIVREALSAWTKTLADWLGCCPCLRLQQRMQEEGSSHLEEASCT